MARVDCSRTSSRRRRNWCVWAPRRSPPIADSCRLFQRELAAAAGVPVATSALMQVPSVQAMLPPGKRVGIVTISASTLSPAHLAAAGVPPDTPIAGTENGREFFRVLIRAEKDDLDVALAREDVVNAGKELVARSPGSRRHRARVHQHAALCRRAAGRSRPAGVRYLFDDYVVPWRPAATRLLNTRRRCAC